MKPRGVIKKPTKKAKGGEITYKKKGGKVISYKMTGGQVVDSGYD